MSNSQNEAIAQAEESFEVNQGTMQPSVEMTEQKGEASNSFDAAASIGQYTGDIPQHQEEVQVQTDNMTTDQAIEIAEKS